MRNQRRPRARRGPPGYSLLLTILLLSVLGAGVAVLAVQLQSSSKTTGEMSQKRKMFYTCDGLTRIVTKLSHDYLSDATSPNSTDLKNYICAQTGNACPDLPAIRPSGYTVDDFDVTVAGNTTAPVPSGPFQDMNARQTTIELELRATKNGTGFACEQRQEVTLAQIGLFQFFVFAEEFVDVYPGGAMTIDGRVHVNGDFCGSRLSSNDLKIETITATGNIYADDNDCPRFWQGASSGYLLVKEKGTSNWLSMTGDNDHTCTTCGGTPWADYARSRWKNNVLDSSHDVPTLKVPVAGSPPVQDGLNTSGGVKNNSDSQRFLVDPPRGTESSDISDQRLAIKADIRIVDGVWYKKNPVNAYDWPGIPIWSDHPGSWTNVDQESVGGTDKVGQADILTDQGYSGVPTWYSYYEYDPANDRVYDNNEGVISYGALYRRSSTTWKPGFFMHHNAAPSPNTRDPDGVSQHRFCTFNGSGSLYDVGDFALVDAETQACYACTGDAANVDSDCTDTGDSLVDLGLGAKYLHATRSGFTDVRVEEGAGTAQSRILPVNFDVAAFAAAMNDTGSGELGDHFNSGNTFNGVVYITYTWPNQMTNFGANGAGPLATRWPDPGAVNDNTQPQHHTNHTSDNHFSEDQATTGLPWPLCSGTDYVNGGLGYGAERHGFSRPADDFANANGFEPYFTVPSCTASTTTRPSAIRVHNAYTIDPTRFPKGLTIATNLPAYVLGDFNKNSSDNPSQWKPVLVAADAVTLLSSAWKDENSRWTVAPELDDRVPVTTRWNTALLTGDVSTSTTAWGGGINNFPRFMEKWPGTSTAPAIIYGSFVMGFRSVFQRDPWAYGEVYSFPQRDWFYETNFEVITNQPPGTPVYNIKATRRWTAE